MRCDMKPVLIVLLSVLSLTACQSIKAPPTVPLDIGAKLPTKPIVFDITGKMSLITQTTPTQKKATTAFYHWQQDGDRFAIDLTGAFGMGATQIRYDGQTATLTMGNQTLNADNPNELLYKATGLSAPIDKLPHWMVGRAAQGDTDSVFDGGVLTQSKNGDWTAIFEYGKQKTPERLRLSHTDGHKITLLINQ